MDNGGEGWMQHVGMVPAVLEGLKPGAANTLAIVCGPPIVIELTPFSLDKLGLPNDAIILKNGQTTIQKVPPICPCP